jgi:redox-sensitive bicupin YhaK (pirin superfamily)
VSNLDLHPASVVCGGPDGPSHTPVHDLIRGREVPLAESSRVRRLLPTLGRRLVGAWCFVDHYGPDNIADAPGMQVPPHPHTGLQTVSWLLDGEVLHRDSLGSEQLVRPGELSLMTAGRAIAHSEQSPAEHAPVLHGAQLWVALPSAVRHIAPAFEHHGTLPVLTDRGAQITVLVGELAGARSPATTYSALLGADLALSAGADVAVPLEPEFEHAVLVASGAAAVDGVDIGPGSLLYLGCGRAELRLRSSGASRMLLLGGEPFTEQIVMWWNFVAGSAEEIADARKAWMTTDRFGTVHGNDTDRLPAPALPAGRLRPRGRTR